jgi:hypothetical protein
MVNPIAHHRFNQRCLPHRQKKRHHQKEKKYNGDDFNVGDVVVHAGWDAKIIGCGTTNAQILYIVRKYNKGGKPRSIAYEKHNSKLAFMNFSEKSIYFTVF